MLQKQANVAIWMCSQLLVCNCYLAFLLGVGKSFLKKSILTLLAPGYFRGSAAASANEIGVSNKILGYKLAQNSKMMFFTPNHEKNKYSL